jgi:thiol-disulfide isomerase/thioredoxin
MRYHIVFIVLLLAGGLQFERARAESPAVKSMKTLAAEYDRRYTEARTLYRAEKNDDHIDEAARNYRAKVHQLEVEFSHKFLTLAEQNPHDAVAVDALVRAAQMGAGETADSEKALTLLERDHLRDGKLSDVLTELGYSKWSGSEHFLRSVLQKSTNHKAQGLAAYWLAYRLKAKAFEELSGTNADQAAQEAEILLKRVIDKYADVSVVPQPPLGKRAQSALAELQRLAIGHVAPEIEGRDGDDKPFKLSDYRGKVVVLDFWGHWCPDCRGVYPKQKALVSRLEGKPFALIGVNSDENKDKLKKDLEQRGVTWRYWWDGGSRSGPISSSWNIQSWPTIYVIDQKGVIRYKGHEELAEKLDKLVDDLLKEPQTGTK